MSITFESVSLLAEHFTFSFCVGPATPHRVEAFNAWLVPFTVPKETLPEMPENPVGACSVDGWIYFFQWYVDLSGAFVIGRPIVPNAGDCNLPPNKAIGYRIPGSALESMSRECLLDD